MLGIWILSLKKAQLRNVIYGNIVTSKIAR